MSENNNQNSETKNELKFIELADFKSLDEDSGGFAGYGNNFGVLDSYNDITISGCFSEGLKDFIDSGFGGVDHRWGLKDEIGIVGEAFEDPTGLFIKIYYHPTADAQTIREKINNRLANNKKCALSIGYRVLESEYVIGEKAAPFLINPSQKVLTYLKEKQPYVRLLRKVKLYEVSPVSVGANTESEISEAKSAVLEGRKALAEHGSNSKKLQILNLKLRNISA